MLNARPAFPYQPEGLDVALMARYLREKEAGSTAASLAVENPA